MSEETEKWVEEQNETTCKYLERIPYRNKIKNRLIDLLDYEKVSAPFVEGKYTYFYKNSGLQDQSILYRYKENDEPEIFLDPKFFRAQILLDQNYMNSKYFWIKKFSDHKFVGPK